MSDRYPGSLITKTPVTPAGPYQTGAAPGVWTLDQQMQFQKQGIWPTAGLVNLFVEDVFSTYIYNGNGSTQTITNGIDLSGKGGLVWTKARSNVLGSNHALVDTVTGAGKYLVSASTAAQGTASQGLTSFNSTGYSLGLDGFFNDSPGTYVGWTFRKQPKFFDIVTYTGTGSAHTIAHNLGSTPGCIIVKRTDASSQWFVYHSGLTSASYYVTLNTTDAQALNTGVWNATAPTSSVFSIGVSSNTNASGGTYVAYIFASNAGGFGASGTDNVITCGSFTTDSSANATVTLGYEPQWILIKNRSNNGYVYDWTIWDTMRGWTAGPGFNGKAFLMAYSSASEVTPSGGAQPNGPTATGFNYNFNNAANENFIYIAIRRGPMKTPTSGTSVYNGILWAGTGSNATVTGIGFTPDLSIIEGRNLVASNGYATFVDRLRGTGYTLFSQLTQSEVYVAGRVNYNQTMDGVGLVSDAATNASGENYIDWFFKRAPGFFDEVCWTMTGTGGYLTVQHNLGVTPNLIIFKSRSGSPPYFDNWKVGSSVFPNGFGDTLELNETVALSSNSGVFQSVNSTSFGVYNASGFTDPYVAYLFASCPGVSKVGSYTGTGATQTINCGFTGGARFVLIKRTDSTGDWYVWDTARGMVSGTDPSLLLNTTAAEVNANSVYTTGVGFQIVSTAAGINASGGTYIYLAIA